MARTPSSMIPLGTSAPLFRLPNVINETYFTLRLDPQYKATLIFFICNHCPYVKHINQELVRLANDYIPQHVQIIAINSNDVEAYPDDSPEQMKITAKNEHYPFPYLFDETQEVAKAYQAACTPDFYLFDSQLLLVYRGQLDDSRPNNGLPVNGKSLRTAIDNLLTNKPLLTEQKPSLGCNIKWK